MYNLPSQTHWRPALHNLIPFGPALPGALTVAEIDATMAYAEAEKALATRARLRRLVRLQGRHSLPADVGIVAAYLSGLRTVGARPARSVAVPRPSATTTRWPATSHRPAVRP